MQGLIRGMPPGGGPGAPQHAPGQEAMNGEAGHPLSPGPQRIGVGSERDVEAGEEPRETFDIEPGERRRSRLRPLYEVWPSDNIFFCKGLLMTGGTDECYAPNICIWTCIMVPCSCFFGWVFPSLWKRGAYALPMAVLVLFFVTTGLLLATCCTDPGIIPRREVILATRCAAELQAALGYDVLGGSSSGAEPQIDEKLRRKGYRWCRTCRIVRPPRASHCSDCDNCVLRYDHHCPFVNNCVGQRNYHFFFGFITSVLVLAVLVIPSILTFFSALDGELMAKQMSQVSGTMWVFLWAVAAIGILIIIAALLGLLLWFYHVFLITTNKTTKEYRKSLANVAEEPTLCSSRGPSLFDPWFMVDPDDIGKSRS